MQKFSFPGITKVECDDRVRIIFGFNNQHRIFYCFDGSAIDEFDLVEGRIFELIFLQVLDDLVLECLVSKLLEQRRLHRCMFVVAVGVFGLYLTQVHRCLQSFVQSFGIVGHLQTIHHQGCVGHKFNRMSSVCEIRFLGNDNF